MESRPHRVALLVAGLTSSAQAAPDLRCGLSCLYVGLKAVDVQVGSLTELEQRLGPVPAGGYSLGQLQDAAVVCGAHALVVTTTLERLTWRERPFAVIAHIDGTHFVKLTSVARGMVSILDPPHASIVSPAALSQRWNGAALLVAIHPLRAEEELRAPVNWWRWLGGGLAMLGFLGVAGHVWSRRAAASLVFLLLLPTSGCSQTPAAPRAGRLRLPLREIDLGPVALTATGLRMTVPMENVGSGPLIPGDFIATIYLATRRGASCRRA